MKTIGWVCILLIYQAQAQVVVLDSSILLDEVIVFGLPLQEYAAGSSIRSIELGNSGSLQNLGLSSSLFFKNYGNGGLSTISLRGTSASHTNVLWNGLPTNSPTLGQTDYSVWPSFLLDNVTVQKGSSGALFGSGSIGGSILMDNSKMAKDSTFTLYTGVGSFGERNGGLKLQFQITPRLQLESRLFYGQIKNDFKYSLRGEEVRQPSAEIQRLGASQKAKYVVKDHVLFSEIAYAENDREIQPTKTNASRNQLLTKNLRAVLSYEQFKKKITLFTSIGYVGETTFYNTDSKTQSHVFSGQYAADFSMSEYVSTRIGINTLQTWGQSENYSDTQQSGQVHLFASISAKPISQLRFSLNLREAFHDDNAVFVPSIGVEGLSGDFTFRAQASKGYRVPTFNDRFWNPGGNPDLNPEKSDNLELGIDFKDVNKGFSITGFVSQVSDWIQWIPSEGVWTPFNLREVVSKGIESNGYLTFPMNSFSLTWSVDYEFILSSDEGIEAENQLPYVPKHSGYSSLSITKENFKIKTRANYTGVRYTTLTNSTQSEIDDYLLFDIIIEYQNLIRIPRMDAILSTNNILDTSYENVKNTAMPGRNFLVELNFKF